MFYKKFEPLVIARSLKHKYAWFNYTLSLEAEILKRKITVTCSLNLLFIKIRTGSYLPCHNLPRIISRNTQAHLKS
jgi:hypothetical protein